MNSFSYRPKTNKDKVMEDQKPLFLMKSHTGYCLTLGTGSPTSGSQSQKINTRSLTAMTRDNQKPVTGRGEGTIFHSTNQTPSLTNKPSLGESIIQQADPCVDLNTLFVVSIPILSYHPLYQSTFATTETSASSKMNNYIINISTTQEASPTPPRGNNINPSKNTKDIVSGIAAAAVKGVEEGSIKTKVTNTKAL